MVLDLPDGLVYALGVFVAAALNFIVLYGMWKLEEIQRDLLTLNGYNRMHALGKVRRWINGIFACFLLVAGHRILFLINFPMLAWEVYEALNKKIYINVITTRDFYMHEMPRHYLYLCFFIMILCVYLDLLLR